MFVENFAGVPERSKGVDLRSTASASWVRIPPPANTFKYTNSYSDCLLSRWSWVRAPHETYVSLAQSVERCNKCILNSSSLSSVVERGAYDAVVEGSIPSVSTLVL